MSVLILLIAAGGLVALGFLAGFLWAVGSGQFDDLATPAIRVLFDDRDHRPHPSIHRHEGSHAD